jgi:hypothetical protein
VTVLEFSLLVVYDTLMKRDEEVINNNTRYIFFKEFGFETIEPSAHHLCELVAEVVLLESTRT